MIGELVDKYFKAHGFVRQKGDSADITPLMPFLLLDLQYSYYQKTIAPLKVTQEVKRVRNVWKNAYNKVNKDFFRCYDEKDRDDIIDLMDSLEEAIKHHMLVFRVQIMNCIIDDPLDKQEVYSTCAICNVLSRCALFYFGLVYADRWGEPMRNNAIKQIQDSSILFGTLYRNLPDTANYALQEHVDTAINVLCKKIVDWMKKKREEEKNDGVQATA